jgi:hypothetical protein
MALTLHLTDKNLAASFASQMRSAILYETAHTPVRAA